MSLKRGRSTTSIEQAAALSLVRGLEKQHYLHATASDDWEWIPSSSRSAAGALRFGDAAPVPAELIGLWRRTGAAVKDATEPTGTLRWAYAGGDLPTEGAVEACAMRALAVEGGVTAFAESVRAETTESVAFVLAIIAGGALSSTRGVYRGPTATRGSDDDAEEVSYFSLSHADAAARAAAEKPTSATSDAVVSAIVRAVQTGALANHSDAIEAYLRARGFTIEPMATPHVDRSGAPAHVSWKVSMEGGASAIAIECGFDDAGRLVALKNRSPPSAPAAASASVSAAALAAPPLPAVESGSGDGVVTISVTPTQRTQLRRIFAMFDADGDGVLNFAEANALQMATEEDDEGYDYETFTWICHMFDREPIPGLSFEDIVRLFLDESLPFEADLIADFAKLFPDG